MPLLKCQKILAPRNCITSKFSSLPKFQGGGSHVHLQCHSPLGDSLQIFFTAVIFSERIRLNMNKLVELSSTLKAVSPTFLLVCFACLKESTFETRESVFLFCLESSSRSDDNQILTFQIFKCHDVIKCPWSMKD